MGFSPEASQFPVITQYFKDVSDGMRQAQADSGGPAYAVGVYGEGDLCNALAGTSYKGNPLVTYTWVSESYSYPGSGLGAGSFSGWNLKQYEPEYTTLCGITASPGNSVADRDESKMGSGGGFRVTN